MPKPRDRVTPFFDLFDRLGDEEIARLASVQAALVNEVRTVVEAIYDPLREYEKLLTQLDDRQIAKLFGMPESAARIWRLARAPASVSVAERAATGVLDPILGDADDDDDDDDLLIVVDEPPITEPPVGGDDDDDDDVDWGDI